MYTTIRVSAESRDALAQIASDMKSSSLEEALRTILFEHQSRMALARLAADPDAAGSYLAESAQLAEVDVAVKE
jgi:hypothetical protein